MFETSIPAIGTIICAVDATEHAGAVIYAAAGLAQHPQSRLVVLRIDSRAGGTEAHALAAHAELDELVTASIPGSIAYRDRTELIVRAGDPGPTILGAARACNAALIVMGTRARGALGRALLGSTAQRVIQGTTIPVAIVPPTDPEIATLSRSGAVPHFGVVLVPLDLQAAPDNQLRVASLLGTGSPHRLVLLTAVLPGSDTATPLERLTSLARSVTSPRGARAVVKEGRVSDVIARISDADEVGFVILGRDRTSGGAVACEVLRRTSAVVIVVP